MVFDDAMMEAAPQVSTPLRSAMKNPPFKPTAPASRSSLAAVSERVQHRSDDDIALHGRASVTPRDSPSTARHTQAGRSPARVSASVVQSDDAMIAPPFMPPGAIGASSDSPVIVKAARSKASDEIDADC